jgi:hypothetical protein
MRVNYDLRIERKKSYWLGITGSVLIIITIVTAVLKIG